MARATSAIPTFDVGLNPQFPLLLTAVNAILTQDTITANSTKAMEVIKTERQVVSYALNTIQVLADFGKLASENPLTDIVNGVNNFLTTRSSFNSNDPEFASYINTVPSFSELRYTGTRFEGKNAGFVDNVVGLDGNPVSAHREPPRMILSVPQTVRDAIGLVHDVRSISNTPNPNGVKTSFRQVSDGVILRQAHPLDNLYIERVQKGGPRSAMEFAGLVDGLAHYGWTYEPVYGLAPTKTSPGTRFNLTNTLSGGAWYAVETFNRKQEANGGSAVANPYERYGYYLAPTVSSMMGKLKPGLPMPIDAKTVERAREVGPRYDTKVQKMYVASVGGGLIPTRIARSRGPSDIRTVENADPGPVKNVEILGVSKASPEQLQAAQANAQQYMRERGATTSGQLEAAFRGVLVEPNNLPPAYRDQSVAVITPSAREVETYLGEIFGNDVALSENMVITGFTAKFNEFAMIILQALQKMRDAVGVLRQASSLVGAVEEITTVLTLIDQTLAGTQEQIYKVSSDIQKLLQVRYDILNRRQEIVVKARAALEGTATTKLMNAYAEAQQAYGSR